MYFYIGGTIILGALPYVLTSIPLYFWFRKKEVKQIKRVLLVSPLLMLAVESIFFLILCEFEIDIRYFNLMSLVTSITIAVGYSWILLVFIIGKNIEKKSVTVYKIE